MGSKKLKQTEMESNKSEDSKILKNYNSELISHLIT